MHIDRVFEACAANRVYGLKQGEMIVKINGDTITNEALAVSKLTDYYGLDSITVRGADKVERLIQKPKVNLPLLQLQKVQMRTVLPFK